MSSAPSPKVSRSPRFPYIWVVPALAVAIGAWMGIRELRNRGPEITIDFIDAEGVEAGKTLLYYKGVVAGNVTSVQLQPGLNVVSVGLRLHKRAKDLGRQGSRFWIVRPEIGFSGVHGLETLVSGVKLTVSPGHGPVSNHFIGLEDPPPPEFNDAGRTFILRCDRLNSLNSGAPVFYREFKVGEVVASRLSPDATAVLIRIHVFAPYVDLVRNNTKFWNAGGLSLHLSLFGGAKIQNTSLESLVSGGVAFATPDGGELAPVASADAEFSLAAEPDKDWFKWSPKIPVNSPEGRSEGKQKGELLNELVK